MESQRLADLLIALWAEGPGALSEESRKRCREVQRIFARALSGSDLVSLQEEPQENRQRIEDLVAVYLAMSVPPTAPERAGSSPAAPERGGSRPPSPPREEKEIAPLGESAPPSFRSAAPVLPASPSAAPADGSGGVRIRQSNQGGVNVGTLGTLEGGLHVGAASPAPSSPPASTSPASKESERTRILFLGASPSDQAPLRLDEEVRAIDRALASATLGNRC
ncbi:MAG TPA: hypothetical protein VGQ28_12805, partial [Thermoanaerobaculia bacterium]|nr:hypothetical protein [Thermoanaerobaculia bacterium]